jgi:hypothetical protein
MNHPEIIHWLLRGDISIQYQTHRDLLDTVYPELQERIALEGWGKQFLDKRHPEGHWGKRFYEPKWISSHYTLLDLRNLNISPDQEEIRASIDLILQKEVGKDGGVNPIGSVQLSDVCINGMFLNYASYFKADEKGLESIVDFLLTEKMPDGGFNCRSNRSGAHHSSLHTTISVLEGITEYQRNGYQYRLAELEEAKESSIEFILMHQLFRSDHTGEVIHPGFLRLPYPSRWKYDILRCLDYLQYAQHPWDDRMQEALDVLLKKRNRDGTWTVQAKYPGKLHFEMEKAGKPSRWNTLRALRVLKHFQKTSITHEHQVLAPN